MRHSMVSFARSDRGWLASLVAVAACLAQAAPAAAQVPGFGLLDPSLWRVNQGDTGTPASLIEPGKVELTNANGQWRSIMYRQPQEALVFTASLTYEPVGAISRCCSNPGFCIVIHNDARGASALGAGPNLYGYDRIRDSVAVVFDVETNQFGFWTNGEAGSLLPTGTVDLDAGNPIDIQVEYDGNLVTVRATDTVSGAAFSRLLIVGDISDHLGASSGIVGVGAATGDWIVGHTFSNFAFAGGAPCPADMDFDGELTIFDFLAFQNLFDLQDPRADFDGDGDFTIFDFLAFQNAFDAGCP